MVGMVVFVVKMKRKVNQSRGRRGGQRHISPLGWAGGTSE